MQWVKAHSLGAADWHTHEAIWCSKVLSPNWNDREFGRSHIAAIFVASIINKLHYKVCEFHLSWLHEIDPSCQEILESGEYELASNLIMHIGWSVLAAPLSSSSIKLFNNSCYALVRSEAWGWINLTDLKYWQLSQIKTIFSTAVSYYKHNKSYLNSKKVDIF